MRSTGENTATVRTAANRITRKPHKETPRCRANCKPSQRKPDARATPECLRPTPHHLRRAARCELQDNVFKKITTPEHRRRPIRRSWTFIQSVGG